MSDDQRNQASSTASTGELLVKAEKYSISDDGKIVKVRTGIAYSRDANDKSIGSTPIGPDRQWEWNLDEGVIKFPYEKSEMTSGLPTERAFRPTSARLKGDYWRYDARDPETLIKTSVLLRSANVVGIVAEAGCLLERNRSEASDQEEDERQSRGSQQ